MSICILVLNYNGADLLKNYLPSVVEAAENSSLPCRVAVLDNCSTDSSEKIVSLQFPTVDWISAKSNRILFSYNEVVRNLNEEFVLLLNNDVKVEKDFINPLHEAIISNKNVAFSSPRHLDASGAYNGGQNRWGLRGALPWAGPVFPGNEETSTKKSYTLYTGNGLFRRNLFVELGGFNDLFSPMGWEDTDFGMRAWKRGYCGVYDPKSVIYHMHSVTMSIRFSPYTRNLTGFRNSFLWYYSNISSPWLWMFFIISLLPTLILCLMTMRFAQVHGFFKSLKRLPCALRQNKSRRRVEIRSDIEVYRNCSAPLR